MSQTTATRLIQKYVQQDRPAGTNAIATHTKERNSEGRLTQQQYFLILDTIPNHVCVVDQDLVCLAKKHQNDASGNSQAQDEFLTTAMYRKDYIFFGFSSEMQLFLQDAVRSGWQELSVLIQGESGTGKSVFARYIHEVGSRRKEPFVSINCASIPQNLIESELFGYEKGAFTGAGPQGRKGLFQIKLETFFKKIKLD